MNRGIVTALVLISLMAALAGAQTPSPGARSVGMGGAFVATGNDATALWGNPASLSSCSLGCGVLFGGGIATDENGFARRLRDDFEDVDLGTLSDPSRIRKLVGDLESFQRSGTGTIGSGSAGLGYAIGGFGIGIGETVYAGAYPDVQFLTVGGERLPSPASSVTLKGLEARELRVGYSGALGGFTIGADVRYIQGRTYFAQESLAQAADSSVSILREALRNGERKTNRVAIDAGALYQAMGKLRLGIVGLSLNEPQFDLAPGGSIPLPRVVRAGAAFAPLSFDGVVLAVDADLNKQKTLVPGLSSRRIAAGAQIYFLRLGAFRDLEGVDPHWAYTGGLQLPLKLFSIEVSGVYSSDKRDVGAAAEIRVKI
jgi:F plasmid transfer operon protein TraF